MNFGAAEPPRVLGLVADDLTGAADSAAGFADQGWRVVLHLGTKGLAVADPSTSTVLAVTTGSRAMPDDEAASATASAVDALAAVGAERLYLKIDSTVRGSVAGQLDGALSAWSRWYPEAAAVICPAFPAQRRTVVGSNVLVDGVPVGQTAAAADPVSPRTISDLTEIIPGALPGRVGDRALRLILDATTDADLDLISTRLAGAGSELIMVGSGGLAAALGRAWSPTGARRTSPVTGGRILVAVSSLHPATADQLAPLHPAMGIDVLTPTERTTVPTVAAAELAERVAAALTERPYGALVLVGGDGAAAVLAHLGAEYLSIDGTIVGGCATGVAHGGTADGLRLITKAGGFGDPRTLETIVARLRAGSRADHDEAAPRSGEKVRP